VQDSQCASCKHYQGAGTCKAFEGKDIPADIFSDKHDHRKPFKGDGGTMFEQNSEMPGYYEKGEPEE